MTAPVPDLSFIIPSKAKTWVGLLGSALSFAVPYLLQVTDTLPAPWPAVIGVVLFILSALGIYKAPYARTGTVLAVDPTADKVSDAVPANAPVAAHPDTVVLPPPSGGDPASPWR